MKKIALEEQQKRKTRFTLISSLFVGVTVLLAFLQLLLANHLAGFGRELQSLASKEKSVSAENELLKKEIAKESSLAVISEKANILSFGTVSQFLVIEDSESVALLHSNGL